MNLRLKNLNNYGFLSFLSFLKRGVAYALIAGSFALHVGCAINASPLQQPESNQGSEFAKPVRIGVIHMWSVPTEAPVVVGLRQGLRELGYVEGENLVLEIRGGKRSYVEVLKEVRELVEERVDVLVSAGTKSTQATHKAVAESGYAIPIVFTQVGEPVAAGFVQSLGRPGGNTTGFSHLLPDITGKRLELLQELVPNMRTVLVIFDPGNPTSSSAAVEARQAAEQMGVQLHERHIQSRDEVLTALDELDRTEIDAILVLPDSVVVNAGEEIIDTARRLRIPVIFHDAAWVRRGGLFSYGVSFVDLSRAAATYVDRILKGDEPGDLPVQQPTTFELVINQPAAKEIGLRLPESLLLRATEVIR